MFNKRGIGSEIDWILGVGLFILSVTFIFILFKPGIVPLQDSETLLDILQDGFDGYSNWEIIRVPIFIAPIYADYVESSGSVRLTDKGHPDSLAENNYYDQLRDIIDIIGDGGEQNMKVFYVLRDSTDSVPSIVDEAEATAIDGDTPSDSEINGLCNDFSPTADERGDNLEEFRTSFCETDRDVRGRARHDLLQYEPVEPVPEPDGEPVRISAEANNQINFNLVSNELVIPSNLDITKTKYFLVVSEREINFAFSPDLGTDFVGCYYHSDDEDDAGLTGPTELLPLGGLEEGSCQVAYELGARETLNGIDYSYLIGLADFSNDGGCSNAGYDCVKEVWGFPAAREFMIEVESIPERTGGAEECNSADGQLCHRFPADSPGPPVNQNAFVRQYTRFILSDDGEKIPVIVRLTAW